MADQVQRYEQQTVKAVRGRESSTIARMQGQGWELENESRGRLRTELTFRRPKPQTPWGLVATVAGAAVAVIAVAAGAIALQARDDAPKAQDARTEIASTPSAEPSDVPTPSPPETPTEPPATPSDEPTETQPTEPAADEALTVQNNEDLRRLLATGEDYGLSRSFAATYAGRQIEFDGNVASAATNGDYETRFNFLVFAGDFSRTVPGPGPAFQFRDVNFYDLDLQGRGSSVGMGDNLHIVAEVGEFEARTGLFLLDPVSTRLR